MQFSSAKTTVLGKMYSDNKIFHVSIIRCTPFKLKSIYIYSSLLLLDCDLSSERQRGQNTTIEIKNPLMIH